MRVKMLTLAAGPEGVWLPGEIVNVPEKQAKSLIDGKFAVCVDKPKRVEVQVVEEAVIRREAVEEAVEEVREVTTRRTSGRKRR